MARPVERSGTNLNALLGANGGDMLKEAWDYIYGSKSHMNLAGKILLGVPAAPFVLIFILTWMTLDFLFTKKSA